MRMSFLAKRAAPLVFLMLLCLARTAMATPMTKDMANRYYASCLAKPDIRFSKVDQQDYCACTSAQVMRLMTVEDLRDLKASTYLQNKFLTDIDTPCLGDAVKTIVAIQCMNNAVQLPRDSNADAICRCTAKLTSDWYNFAGRSLMVRALKNDPDATDPLSVVQNTIEFKTETKQNLQSCTDHPQ
jgi:hypothetical protein